MELLNGFIVLMVTAVVTHGRPQYQVVLDTPLRFLYRSGRANMFPDESCCAVSETPPCTIPCADIQVDVCFREFEEKHSNDDLDFNNCPLGGQTFTSPFTKDGPIFFPSSINTTTNTYPGIIQYVFRVRASQSGSERVVDSGHGLVTFPVSTDRDDPVFRNSFLNGEHSIGRVITGLAIVCSEGFIGSNCGVEVCVPRDDPTGHFTCDASQNRVCLQGYQNPETYCVDQTLQPTPEVTTTPSLTNMETQPTTQLKGTTVPYSNTQDTITTFQSFTSKETTTANVHMETTTLVSLTTEHTNTGPGSSIPEQKDTHDQSTTEESSLSFTLPDTSTNKVTVATPTGTAATIADTSRVQTEPELTPASTTVRGMITAPLSTKQDGCTHIVAGVAAGGTALLLLVIVGIVLVVVTVKLRRKGKAKDGKERVQADQITQPNAVEVDQIEGTQEVYNDIIAIQGSDATDHVPMETNVAYRSGDFEDMVMEEAYRHTNTSNSEYCEITDWV